VVILDGLVNKDYLVGLECQDMLLNLVILVGLVGVDGLENLGRVVILAGPENRV
jgi:hypothetical protein